MHCRADPHGSIRRHHHPDLLTDALPGQHNVRSERLGHPHGERKSAFKLKPPEPNAKSGGVLRHGMPLRAPHFDIHEAGTIFILGASACMFDNLIRRDPNDGAQTIIPDLAHSWEIAPDGQTYTFHPRPISFMMSAFASGWNVIVRQKTLEDNNYNLRKVVTYPGTGPFRSVRRVENEVWVMERNPNYWNKALPYLDGIDPTT